MIAHLTGTLLDKQVQRLVVDVHGVGYEVLVPLSTFYAVGDPGREVALRIHTVVREDAIQLFGFSSALELALFERLIGVTRVGPKLALAVLSGIEPPELVRAIRQGDVARLARIPGVGRKSAERLVVEMKDRLPAPAADAAEVPEPEQAGVRDDLLSALANLGYQPAAAEKAVDQELKGAGDSDFEPLLRAVLRRLAG
ncbi:MAG: Holliday junction branch migration protein RuvA [Vicinamibacterales bacterium]